MQSVSVPVLEEQEGAETLAGIKIPGEDLMLSGEHRAWWLVFSQRC